MTSWSNGSWISRPNGLDLKSLPTPSAVERLVASRLEIGPIVENHRRLRAIEAELESARHELQSESDPEFRELARELIAENEAEEARLHEKVRVQLLPADPNDDRDVIIEIRGGTGGEEAAIFAADLYRMYARYAERQRWKSETLSANELGVKGLREVIFEISGQGCLEPPEVRGWRPPGAACAGYGVERSHPYLDGDGGGAAQGG